MDKQELVTFTGIGGQTRFRCPDCGFDSYATKEVYKHWLSTHREQEEPSGGVLFDADEKLIKKEIHVPEVFRSFSPSSSRS